MFKMPRRILISILSGTALMEHQRNLGIYFIGFAALLASRNSILLIIVALNHVQDAAQDIDFNFIRHRSLEQSAQSWRLLFWVSGVFSV